MNEVPISPWVQFLPFVLFAVLNGLVFGITAYLLAKEKGRNVAVWTLLGLIPFLNLGFIWFFVGAANLRLERKIDALLKARGGEV
jgi:hypothetical protein